MDFHSVNLGPIPTVAHMSRWWRQEGHPVKTAHVYQKLPTLHVGTSSLRNQPHYLVTS